MESESRHEMAIMDPQAGDLKVIWDPNKPEEVEAAREQFKAMKKKGYTAYRVDEKGERARVMHDFDPQAKAVIMAPFVAGG